MSATYVKLASNGDPVFTITVPMSMYDRAPHFLGLDSKVVSALRELRAEIGDGHFMHISYVFHVRRDGTKGERLRVAIVEEESEETVYELCSNYIYTTLHKNGSSKEMFRSRKHFDTPLRQRIRKHHRAGVLIDGVEQHPFSWWGRDLE
jgi:hypothetical protein